VRTRRRRVSGGGAAHVIVARADLVEERASLRAVQPDLANHLQERIVPRADLLAHRAVGFVQALLEQRLQLDDVSTRRGLRQGGTAGAADDAAVDGIGRGEHGVRLSRCKVVVDIAAAAAAATAAAAAAAAALRLRARSRRRW
jgi:hypothetical protein